MKKIVFIIIACFSLTTMRLSAQQDTLKKEEGLTWYTDIMKANEVSQASGKPLFAFFTGSDWCGWCKNYRRM